MSERKRVQNHDELVPLKFQLGQNYPNPFHDKTMIKYCVPYQVEVEITIHDMKGTLVRQLLKEIKGAGTYEIEFDADGFPEGTYLYRMKACDYTEEKEMDLAGTGTISGSRL